MVLSHASHYLVFHLERGVHLLVRAAHLHGRLGISPKLQLSSKIQKLAPHTNSWKGHSNPSSPGESGSIYGSRKKYYMAAHLH